MAISGVQEADLWQYISNSFCLLDVGMPQKAQTFDNHHLPEHILCHVQLWSKIKQVFGKHIPLLKMQSNGGSKSVQSSEKKNYNE